MTDQVHLWSGLYATDALDEPERKRFEDHLAACPDCQAEVAGFRDALAIMADAASGEPPASARADVLAMIGDTRQEPPLTPTPATPRAPDAPLAPVVELRSNHRWAWVGAVAAAIVLVVGASVWIGNTSQRATDAEQVAAIVASADARTIRLEGEGRAGVKLVWSPERSEAVLLADDLADVSNTKAYELWAIRDGKPEQVTTFRPDDSGTVRARFDADLTGADAVGVTVEPKGGSDQPTTPIILSSTVS